MESKNNLLLAALEALLFVNGEALTLALLEKILKISGSELQTLLAEYEEKLTARESSLILIRDTKSVRLGVANGEVQEYLESLAKSELQEGLSKAALEVLAIVAYLAPVSRAQIDAIRGVNSHFTLRNLSLRGLLDRSGNPKDARGYVYETSMNFLTTLGLSSIEKLPNYNALRNDERLSRLQNKKEESFMVLETE
jgi:segregation and condensation protein B